MAKRFKFANEEQKLTAGTSLAELPNEIYREIFDYLSSLDIIHSFSQLNYRLNAVIETTPMKLHFDHLNKQKYQRVLKHVVPTMIDRTVAIQLGQPSKTSSTCVPTMDPEYLIDLFSQSFHLTQFEHLRFLSLTSPSFHQLDSLLPLIPHLKSLRSFRLLESHESHSQHETIGQLVLANRHPLSSRPTSRLTHVYIAASPPFRTLTLLLKHWLDRVSLDYLHLTIRCAFFFFSQALVHLPCEALSRLVPNMTYFGIDMRLGTFTAAFDLIRRFSPADHLSIKTALPAYANGHHWADLFSQMPKLVDLDLDIHVDSARFDQELETFQTEFWFERQWIVQSERSKIGASSRRLTRRSVSFR